MTINEHIFTREKGIYFHKCKKVLGNNKRSIIN
jgi:hypothetical protein